MSSLSWEFWGVGIAATPSASDEVHGGYSENNGLAVAKASNFYAFFVFDLIPATPIAACTLRSTVDDH
ncbi:MAG: hypothetical protein ACR2NX_10445 [Chthoniobacterales bacterium]